MTMTNLTLIESANLIAKAAISGVAIAATTVRIAGSELRDTEFGTALSQDTYAEIFTGEGATSDYLRKAAYGYTNKPSRQAKTASLGGAIDAELV